jgi:hypothetical protein
MAIILVGCRTPLLAVGQLWASRFCRQLEGSAGSVGRQKWAWRHGLRTLARPLPALSGSCGLDALAFEKWRPSQGWRFCLLFGPAVGPALWPSKSGDARGDGAPPGRPEASVGTARQSRAGRPGFRKLSIVGVGGV